MGGGDIPWWGLPGVRPYVWEYAVCGINKRQVRVWVLVARNRDGIKKNHIRQAKRQHMNENDRRWMDKELKKAESTKEQDARWVERSLHKASVESLISENKDQRRRYGLEDIPTAKMMEQVQYIEKNLLPAIKKKSGDKSADYVFFKEIVKSLLWAIVLIDRFDMLDRRVGHILLENAILRQHLELYQRELAKFHAVEDIYLTDGKDIYIRGVAQRVKDRLTDEENRGKNPIK